MSRRRTGRVGALTAILAAAAVVTATSGAATVTIAPPPSGQAALAVSVAVQHGALTLVGADGTGVKVLAVGTGDQQLRNPAWSPDGHRLAYTATLPAAGRRAASSAVMIETVGGHPRALTARRPGRLDDGAAFSTLGTRVAFSRGATAAGTPSRILVVSASFGAPTALTSGRSGGHVVRDTDPAWSPSGARIAFTRTVGTRSSIWIMSSNGTGARQVIASGQQPAWSPDGQQLAFVSRRDANGRCGRNPCAELYVSANDGSQARRLTTTALDESQPQWSPDGALIAYARGGGVRKLPSSVFTVSPDADCPFRLTGSASVSAPAWRPGLDPPHLLPAC